MRVAGAAGVLDNNTLCAKGADTAAPREHGHEVHLWLGGMAAVVAAACFQAPAPAGGALSVVQPVFVLELPFALLTGALVLRRRVTRNGWTAVACITAGLGTALAAAAPSAGPARPATGDWVLALACCTGVMAVAVRSALRRPAGRVRAACFAAAALGYALTAALLKDAT